ncbi:MAG: site-2 protease family protein [Blastocatellales bacterium]|nr:site-2 protease family protein [Blastocatellales bacterium]
MESHIRLGSIFGVRIGLHFSWAIIALLIAFSLASRFQQMHPDWGAGVAWATAIVTSALFFASIVVHELSHAMVAKMRNLPVHSITLFALGGVAKIEKEAADASTEFWMGIIGPITSAVIGLLFLGAALLLGWTAWSEPGTPLMSMTVWLGYINLLLAAFNMLPGFPMDGGRVLRAAIWWKTGNMARATRVAALTGQALAFGFIILGIVGFFQGAGFGGLWIAFIGWFLLNAARATYAHNEVNARLRGVRVADVMSRDCPLVDGHTNLQTLVDEHLLRTGRRCYLITENGSPAGLITSHEVKSVERARWPFTTVYDVMVPIDRLRTVSPDMPVAEALEMLGRANVNQLPVVSNGRFEGMLSRDRVLQFLVTRAELDM